MKTKITRELLEAAAGGTPNKEVIDGLVRYLPAALEKYKINTPLRLGHFLAQAAHESAHFKTLKEYWGPTEAQKRYEGRKTLGNFHAGDGKRFMGRGIFQLTGRANYEKYGDLIGVDLVGNPELAAEPKNSVLTACEYWKSKRLNAVADKGDTEEVIREVTKKINGGYNGIEDRIDAFVRVMALIWASERGESEPAAEEVPSTPVEPAPAPVVEPPTAPAPVEVEPVVAEPKVEIPLSDTPPPPVKKPWFKRLFGW